MCKRHRIKRVEQHYLTREQRRSVRWLYDSAATWNSVVHWGIPSFDPAALAGGGISKKVQLWMSHKILGVLPIIALSVHILERGSGRGQPFCQELYRDGVHAKKTRVIWSANHHKIISKWLFLQPWVAFGRCTTASSCIVIVWNLRKKILNFPLFCLVRLAKG